MILVAYTLTFLCLILNGSLFIHLKPSTPPNVQGKLEQMKPVDKVSKWESRVLLVAALIILVLLSGAVSGITRRCYCG